MKVVRTDIARGLNEINMRLKEAIEAAANRSGRKKEELRAELGARLWPNSAERSRVSMLSNLENQGDVRGAKYRLQVLAICEVLGCDANELFFETLNENDNEREER